MDQAWQPMPGGCTFWGVERWGEGAAGDGESYMNGVRGDTVLIAVQVVVVPAAVAVGTCPGSSVMAN
jgi:hypothetical protein